MEKTKPNSVGALTHDEIVYYLEDKLGSAINEAVADVLPELPDTDGDYFLKLTIDDGNPDYEWASLAT